MIITLIAIAWLVCGIGAAGLHVAYFQRRWPGLAKEMYRADLGSGLFAGLLAGPIALLVEFFAGGCAEHGWTLRRPK